jgi:hypothetical protein
MQVFWDVMHCTRESGSVPNILRDYIVCIFKGQALEGLVFGSKGTEMLANIKSHSPNVTADHIPQDENLQQHCCKNFRSPISDLLYCSCLIL